MKQTDHHGFWDHSYILTIFVTQESKKIELLAGQSNGTVGRLLALHAANPVESQLTNPYGPQASPGVSSEGRARGSKPWGQLGVVQTNKQEKELLATVTFYKKDAHL